MSNEELQLKQRARRRLIGAVTLVTGLVVFLPMVLDSEPKPVAEDVAINIPSQDDNVAKGGAGLPQKTAAPEAVAAKSAVAKSDAAPPDALPAKPAEVKPSAPPLQPVAVPHSGQAPKAVPASPSTPPKPDKAAVAPDDLVKEAAQPKPAAPQHQEPTSARPEKPAEPLKAALPREIKPSDASPPEKAKPAAKPTDAAAPAQGGFVVRLGAFSKPENAKQLKAKVAAMGIRNYTGVLKTASGDKTLVRAGPYATRREAELVRDRLKAVDVVGDVVPK